ncbi:hypothetical protein B1H10_01650 [candidate division KSB1 bacterium 4484_188]|nr:MAG: hypothetical protein B1H10_01650 [candidate division KSB1 bacterium 4484_188]
MLMRIFVLFVVCFIFCILPGCEKKSPGTTAFEEPDTSYNGGAVVRKPNIYIYPDKKIELHVALNFSNGGSIINSEPEYRDGWNIHVDKNGLINGKYKYLFYECRVPDLFQYQFGWFIPKDSLTHFFKKNLEKSGFVKNEIQDFLDYWIPRLISYPYYFIYPQFSLYLNTIVELNFSKQPDNVLRLFYVIKGTDKREASIQAPIIPRFYRKGFVAVEWGVVWK